jgi:hypothetical protein
MAYDANHIQQMLSSIQSQLANVSNMAGQLNNTALGQVGTTDMTATMKAMIASEMQRFAPLTAQVAQPLAIAAPPSPFPDAVAPAPAAVTEPSPFPEATATLPEETPMKAFFDQLRSAIGDNLTPDQQVWLSNNIIHLPAFIRTEEGKAIVQSSLKKMYEHLQKK